MFYMNTFKKTQQLVTLWMCSKFPDQAWECLAAFVDPGYVGTEFGWYVPKSEAHC